MKILMTGGSPMQVGSTRTVAKFYSVTHAIRDALLAMGHEVEVRTPRHDDPEAGYDAIIAGLSCIASMNGRWSHDIYAWIGRHAVDGMPLGIYMDDWHMKPLLSTLGSVKADPDRINRKAAAFSRPTQDWVKEPKNFEAVLLGVHAMADGLWPPFLIHQYPWGDLEVLTKQPGIKDAWAFDPSGFYPQYPYEAPDYRANAWTYPRLLLAYDAWLESFEKTLCWPVYKFGNIRNGEKIVPESEVQQVMAEAVGTLFPSNTRHIGSGIWRPRLLQAAQTKTIVFADPGEHMSQHLSVLPQTVEGLSPVDLEMLARAQSEWIRETTWSRQQVCDRLHAFLSHMTGRDLGPAPQVEEAPPAPEPRAANRPPSIAVKETSEKRPGIGAVRGRAKAEPKPKVERPRAEPKPSKPKRERPLVISGQPKVASEYAAIGLRMSDVVLDIGAHRGEFALYADGVVKRLVCYEAAPVNFQDLKRYAPNVEAFNAAVATNEGDAVDLWLCNGSDTSMHSLMPRRGRSSITVPCVDFREVVNRIEPTVIKIAVEGYEHSLDLEELPSYVRAVAIKFHPSTEASRDLARSVVKTLEEQGFKAAVTPQLDKGSWPVVGIWKR